MKRLEPNHVLSKILDAKRKRVADARMRVPEAIVKKMASMAAPRPSFRKALEIPERTRIIAEIKKASPSAGVLIDDLDVASLARAYAQAGASAVSVVTEEDLFQGNLGWVREAADASALPVLRKDFVFDPYQVFETRAAGASAVLLIVAMLDPEELKSLIEKADQVGLDVLVEVHDERELEEALGAGAEVVGVNNRDLRTFEVQLETSVLIGAKVPDDVLFVAESGIHSREDIDMLSEAGADAFLIGERLVRSPDPAEALREML
jgi:indole-3-glycerol phosphate synthase